MKHVLPLLIPAAIFLCSGEARAQLSQGFESQSTSQTLDAASSQYVSAISATSAHELVADMAGGRRIPVSATSTDTELGFRSFFCPTHPGGTGLTDGDFFGYAGQNVILGQLGLSSMQEGSQAFIMEDSDGEITLLFDPVALPANATGIFSMYFAVDGSFENNSNGTNDRYYIALNVTGCPQEQTVVLVDSDGGGSGGGGGNDGDSAVTNTGAMVTEGQWNLLSASLAPYGGCAVQLQIEYDMESASEEFAIDDITFAAGAPLPVEFSGFSALAGEKEVSLNWVTATEISNRGFSVERSMDGATFSSIGWVAGNGSTNDQNTYRFTDENVTAGTEYYYRLRQEDFDGTFAYSDVRVVRITGSPGIPAARLFPNPAAGGQTSLEVFTDQAGPGEVTVFDLNGRQLSQIRQNFVAGTNRIDLNLRWLKKGAYLVRVAGAGSTEALRLTR